MTSALGIQLRKEIRALVPWWLVVAAAVTAAAILGHRYSGFPNFRNDLEVLVVIAHTLGVMVLAAFSIGHELTHGTLPALLVQPMDRRRILFLKVSVLMAALVALGVLAEGLR